MWRGESYKTSGNVRNVFWKPNSENWCEGECLAAEVKFEVMNSGGGLKELGNLLRRFFISCVSTKNALPHQG